MEYPNYTGSEPCAQVGIELFFPDDTLHKQVDPVALRRLCSACDMLEPCREYAIHNQVTGFWGGMTGRERRMERKRRGITAIPIVESA